MGVSRTVQIGDPVEYWSTTHDRWLLTNVLRVEPDGVLVDGKRTIIPFSSTRLRTPGDEPAAVAGGGGPGGGSAAVAGGGGPGGGSAAAPVAEVLSLVAELQPVADTDTQRQRGSPDNQWQWGICLTNELKHHGGVMGLLKAWKNTWFTPDQLAYLRQKIHMVFPVAEPFMQSPFASLPTSSTVKGLVHPQPP